MAWLNFFGFRCENNVVLRVSPVFTELRPEDEFKFGDSQNVGSDEDAGSMSAVSGHISETNERILLQRQEDVRKIVGEVAKGMVGVDRDELELEASHEPSI